MQCLVLSGGRGTRMLPATATIPKPILAVAGEPFAVHQLRWLASEGVTDVVYSIGYLGHLIRAELEGRDLGVALRFVDEGEDLRGTGGAVRLAADAGALDDEFLVLYGDSYLQVDLGALMARLVDQPNGGVMAVFANEGRWDRSNVVFEDGAVVRYDKAEPDPVAAGMRHIDYGVSALRRRTIEDRVPPDVAFDLADLMRDLSSEGLLAGMEVHERFYEIGSPEGLVELEAHLVASQSHPSSARGS